ncbi:MAG: LppU family putative lipoprotein [Rhodococcus sp. (in: high G+C Gram-positive bacteria)]
MHTLSRGFLVAGAALTLLFTAGCSSSESGNAVAADTTTSSSTSAAAGTTDEVSGQEGIDAGGSTDIDVEVGQCVELGGTMTAATIDNAECGSMESNYKVIAKAEANEQCPTDVNQTYYETLDGVEQGALCLDVDWVVDGCMSVPTGGMDEPARVDCNDPSATDVEQVTEIKTGTADPNECPEGGFAYEARQFVVCAATIS